MDRKTIRRYEQHGRGCRANSPGVATGSDGCESAVWGKFPHPGHRLGAPKLARSACEPHRAWIEAQVAARAATPQSIYQDLVERFGFAHRYNSVKRFVRALRAREPERFDVLEFLPGEEAQVDYGQGAPTRAPTRQVPAAVPVRDDAQVLRQVLSARWCGKPSQQIWARLHEEAFRAFGGSVALRRARQPEARA